MKFPVILYECGQIRDGSVSESEVEGAVCACRVEFLGHSNQCNIVKSSILSSEFVMLAYWNARLHNRTNRPIDSDVSGFRRLLSK